MLLSYQQKTKTGPLGKALELYPSVCCMTNSKHFIITEAASLPRQHCEATVLYLNFIPLFSAIIRKVPPGRKPVKFWGSAPVFLTVLCCSSNSEHASPVRMVSQFLKVWELSYYSFSFMHRSKNYRYMLYVCMYVYIIYTYNSYIFP